MILGASHLTFAASDAQQGARTLEGHGLELDFTDLAVINSVEKQPLLSLSGRFAKTMGIRYFKGSVGPAVELLSYPAAGPAHASRFLPEFVPGGFASVTCQVEDVEAAERFWRAAGLKSAGAGMLDVTAPMPQWRLRLKLVPGAAAPATLDSLGCHCLSLLTSALEADLQRLCDAGGVEPTIPFTVVVNKKSLRLAMVRAPGGGLVELIQLQR